MLCYWCVLIVQTHKLHNSDHPSTVFVPIQDLNEKTIDLHTITSNATNTEMALRNEHTTASNMVSTLKEELEKRLKDIMNLREERDTLQVR